MEDVILYFTLKYNGNFKQIYNALRNHEIINHKIFNELKKISCEYITIMSDIYPDNFKKMNNPPFTLFYKGNINLLKEKRKIHFIHANQNKETYKLTENLIKDVNENDYTLISINKENFYAHKNIIVLNKGIDNVSDNKINQFQLIISEIPFTQETSQVMLPMSYRIASSLANKIIIADNHTTQNNLLTIAYAVEQQKDLYIMGTSYELYKMLCNEQIDCIENFKELEDKNNEGI